MKTANTALGLAAMQGHTEIVKVLIDAGADVTARSNGKTALGWAAMQGHKETAKALIAAGADEDHIDKIEDTYLLDIIWMTILSLI